MREIKFRAWVNEKDKEYSRMVHSEQSIVTILGHKYGGKGVAKPAGFSDIDNQPKPERYVLMQYTGLEDKNGREIYEGDILQLNVQDYVAGYPRESNYITKVTHEFGAFWAEGMLLIDAIENDSEIEIIGNIFEHPQLLEVKK